MSDFDGWDGCNKDHNEMPDVAYAIHIRLEHNRCGHATDFFGRVCLCARKPGHKKDHEFTRTGMHLYETMPGDYYLSDKQVARIASRRSRGI